MNHTSFFSNVMMTFITEILCYIKKNERERERETMKQGNTRLFNK